MERQLRRLGQTSAIVEIPPPGSGEPRLVGSSPALSDCLVTLARAASSSATVLVTGESGTGKELVARSLHDGSPRAKGPFIAVNCAAIPEQLLESELFGHERGAFTGAIARKVGRFELATGGTLFLDEIGDMSAVLQAKILRVLEDGAIQRVGGEETVRTDVRIVTATNRDLSEITRDGAFREDLYHRLAVVEIHMPPLRERRTDIRELALYFAAHAAARHGRSVNAISRETLRRLEDYGWPGNIRELRNVMDRAVVLATGPTLLPVDLRLGPNAPHAAPKGESAPGPGFPPSLSLAEVEAEHIRSALEHFDGHIANTADSLGIHRNTLTRKMQELGISP